MRDGAAKALSEPTGLGLDGGGSATRWALFSATGLLASGELCGVSGHLHAPGQRDRFATMATGLRAAVAPFEKIDAVVAGITGMSPTIDEARVAASLLASSLDVPPARIKMENDVSIAYHAAFAPGAGHLVYAGTGSMGTHIRADGTELRVGGRGMLIDDAGSAFWIGREALNRIFRAQDDDPDAGGALAGAVFAAIGDESWDGARAYIYNSGRDAVAQLARAVAAAAEAGDEAALDLLREAGRELARLARALARRAGALPVALLGRAAGLHPVILDSMRAASSPLVVTRLTLDAAATAARLAYQFALTEKNAA
jgi:N-acetylglucosamine kinase-like BadF-type ATPase